MSTPSEPFNDCDCCGYGFNFFSVGGFSEWYIPSLLSSVARLTKYDKNDGSELLITAPFDNSNHVRRIANIGGTLFFYTFVNTGTAMRVRKVQFDGTEEWFYDDTEMVKENNTGNTMINRISVDSEGNVYFFGRVGTTVDNELKIVKISNSGNLVWSSKSSIASIATDHRIQFTKCISVDKSGNVFAGGQVNGPEAFDIGGFYVYYNSSGVEQWFFEDTSEADSSNSFPHCSIFDDSGNVHIAFTRGLNNNVVFRSYDSSGTERFEILSGGAFPTFNVAQTTHYISLLGNSLYVGTPGSGGSPDFYKFSGSEWGTEEWSQSGSGAVQAGQPVFFEVDSKGDLFAAWTSFADSTFTGRRMKITSTGTISYQINDVGTQNFGALVPPGIPPLHIG